MDAEDLFLLGDGLLRRRQIGPALAALGAARDKQPDHAETLDTLARYWEGTRSLTDARAVAEQLSRLPGWEVRGGIRLGRIRAALLDPAGAAGVLTGALQRDPRLTGTGDDPRAVEELLARCLLESGRPAEARRWLDRLGLSGSHNDSPDPEAAWLLSRALLQQGQFAEAAAALARSGDFATSDPLRREPAPFVGASTCAPCHPSQFGSQQSSRHAQTLTRPDAIARLPWPEQPISDRDNPEVTHRFRHAGDRIEAETRVAGTVFHAVVGYALGSNHQGQSFLARDAGGRTFELRASRYPAAPVWDRTMEHPVAPPDASGYLGRPVSAESVRKCFHCHATDFRAVLEPEGRPQAGDHGIGCERCHGPGGHHAAAVAAHFPEPAIARPRLASPARVMTLCAECHTAPPSTTPADAGFVRYQASGLALSRCFTGSSEALGCTTCHDPHRNARTAPKYYEERCLECHSANRSTEPGKGSGPPCPVNSRGDCLPCHMPTVRDAVPRAAFADHWIRVRRP